MSHDKHHLAADLWEHVRKAFFYVCHPKKLIKHYKTRLVRIGASPHRVALGFAIGVGVSLTPFLGFHFIIAIVVAWIARASIVAGLLGTIFGNPLTFPFIWLATYEVGVWLLDIKHKVGDAKIEHVGFSMLFTKEMGIFLHKILLPMAVGCIPFVIVGGLVSYFLVFWLVHFYRTRIKMRRMKRLEEAMHRKRSGAQEQENDTSHANVKETEPQKEKNGAIKKGS